MSVGDVNSAERGSGARYNDGKIDFTLLPPWAWEEYRDRVDDTGMLEAEYGFELDLLAAFWYGNDSALEGIIDNLTAEDIELAARVFAYGADKYAAWNWAKGMKWSVPVACYLRHMLLADPESVDVESGLPHRGHAVCNLIMLAHFVELCRDMDDRPREIRDEFHVKVEQNLENLWPSFEEGIVDLEEDVIEACEKAQRALQEQAEGKREQVRARIQRNLAADEDVFEVTYWDQHGSMQVQVLQDIPTSILNEVVEQAVEEQESRERTLRATGQLRRNY